MEVINKCVILELQVLFDVEGCEWEGEEILEIIFIGYFKILL